MVEPAIFVIWDKNCLLPESLAEGADTGSVFIFCLIDSLLLSPHHHPSTLLRKINLPDPQTKSMKIVITDGYTLNPGDLSWKAFDQLGEVIYYDRSSPSETPGRCREAGVIITNKTPITEEIITSATQLNVIAVTATGYNVVDIAAAKKK